MVYHASPRPQLLPTWIWNHPEKNPNQLFQTKPQSAGFQEGEVHLQETESGQGESPGRPCRKGALRKKARDQMPGVGVGALEQWHPEAPKQGSRAAGLGEEVEELGQEQGRGRGSCTVFWALYMRLRYS